MNVGSFFQGELLWDSEVNSPPQLTPKFADDLPLQIFTGMSHGSTADCLCTIPPHCHGPLHTDLLWGPLMLVLTHLGYPVPSVSTSTRISLPSSMEEVQSNFTAAFSLLCIPDSFSQTLVFNFFMERYQATASTFFKEWKSNFPNINLPHTKSALITRWQEVPEWFCNTKDYKIWVTLLKPQIAPEQFCTSFIHISSTEHVTKLQYSIIEDTDIETIHC